MKKVLKNKKIVALVLILLLIISIVVTAVVVSATKIEKPGSDDQDVTGTTRGCKLENGSWNAHCWRSLNGEYVQGFRVSIVDANSDQKISKDFIYSNNYENIKDGYINHGDLGADAPSESSGTYQGNIHFSSFSYNNKISYIRKGALNSDSVIENNSSIKDNILGNKFNLVNYDNVAPYEVYDNTDKRFEKWFGMNNANSSLMSDHLDNNGYYYLKEILKNHFDGYYNENYYVVIEPVTAIVVNYKWYYGTAFELNRIASASVGINNTPKAIYWSMGAAANFNETIDWFGFNLQGVSEIPHNPTDEQKQFILDRIISPAKNEYHAYGMFLYKMKDLMPQPWKIKINKYKYDPTTGTQTSTPLEATFKIDCDNDEYDVASVVVNGTYIHNIEIPHNVTCSVSEIGVQNGYEWVSNTTQPLTNTNTSVTYYNQPICEARLANINKNYTKGNPSYKAALIDLYRSDELDYADLNGLLNFSNPSCSNIKVTYSNPTSTCMNPYKYESKIDPDEGYKYITKADETVINNGIFAILTSYGNAYCYYDVNSVNSYFENNKYGDRFGNDGIIDLYPVVYSGRMLWEGESGSTLVNSNVMITCNYFGTVPSDSTKLKTFTNQIQTTITSNLNELEPEVVMKNNLKDGKNDMKLDSSSDSPLTTGIVGTSIKNDTNGFYHYQWFIPYYYIFTYGDSFSLSYSKGSGIAESDTIDGEDVGKYNTEVYGIPTAINESKDCSVGKECGIQWDVTLDDKAATSSDYCPYEVIPEIVIDGELKLEFRVIDTENPFPGNNAEGRTVGHNWCVPDAIDEKSDMDDDGDIELNDAQAFLNQYNVPKSPIYNRLNLEILRTALGLSEIKEFKVPDCSNTNDIVTNQIINAPNSYSTEPIFSITLNSQDIRTIRTYNESNLYDDYNLACTDGNECKSSFIDSLFNGTISLSTQARESLNDGSCFDSNAATRNYCVGS